MLSLKDSRHGLSSIYSFVRHIGQSTIFVTVGRCKVLRKHAVTFQLMLILPESFLSSSSLHAVTLLSASMFAAEGGVTSASDEILTNPASANELCFLQIHGSVCMTEDEFCLTVNGSSTVKRCI